MIRLVLERPVSTSIAAATLVAIGTFSLWQLPIAFLPEVERPRLELVLRADGRSQEEMLHGLTLPLERRLTSIPGIVTVRSETSDALTRVVLDTEWQADADRLLMEIARRSDDAGEFEPDEQQLMLVETEASPVVEIGLLGGPTGARRDAFARQVLQPELARLPGAGRIETIGLSPVHAVVRPHAPALAARNLTAADLERRLQAIGNPIAAGRAREGSAVRPLVVRESVTSIEELGAVPVPIGERTVPLRELATIALEEIPDGTAFSRDGMPGVLLRVFRAPGANAVRLARAIRDKTTELNARTRSGLRIEVVTDRSREVIAALSQLALAAFAGILLGTFALRFMLGTWAPTFALAVVIPASMLSSFAAFYFWGLSLNVVSIAGLALASGMLVDNSVVVLEAIETARGRGAEDPRLAGTRQIAMAVMASAVTTIVVFLPLIYLRGLARAFFGEQAFAIVSSLTASLLFSLSLTPVMARRSRPLGRLRAPGLGPLLALLRRALARPALTIVGGALIVAASLTAVAWLPRSLFPPGAERVLRVQYEIPPQLTLAGVERFAEQVERSVSAAALGAGTLLVVRDFQLDSSTRMESRRREGRIDIDYDDAESARLARRRIAGALGEPPDVRWRVAPRPSAFLEVAGHARERVEIALKAVDPERLAALRDGATEIVETVTGRRPVVESMGRPLPVYLLRWDENRLASLGVERSSLEQQLRVSLERSVAGRADIPGAQTEILLRKTLGADPAALPVGPVKVKARTVNGAPAEVDERVVPLAALAQLESSFRPATLYREDGRPALRLWLDAPRESTRRQDVLSLANALEAMPLEAGEGVRLAGQAQEVQRSFAQLRLTLGLALVLVFLTLAAVYESLVLPLLIMTTVPTAAGGGLALLALTGQSLNVMSFLGLILLGGIVVNNAIVLVHRIEQRRAAGSDERAAVIEAVRERYRPILMTTLTTLIGMLPLALLGGDGVELRRALATAVLGGLLTATFASLLLVPVLHLAVGRFRSTVRAGGVR